MNRALVSTILALGLLQAAGPVRAASSDEPVPAVRQGSLGPSVWEDEEFRKRFLGSYGVNAEIEPRVTVVERQQLEKILPILAADPAAAREALEAATTPDSSAVFDFTVANLRFESGDLEGAASSYQAALAKFPSFRRAHRNLGIIRARTGEHGAAITHLSRVIELGGGDGTVYGLLGWAHSSRGQFLSAESAYRNAMLLEPDVLDWKLGLTLAVLKQQRYGEAASLCEELIEAFPDRTDYWLLQANAWIGLGEPLRAAQNFEIVRRMGKTTKESLNTLGDIYVNAEAWDLAASAYDDALRADPEQNPSRPLRNVEVLAQRGALRHARSLLARVSEVSGDRLDADDRKRLLKLEARIRVAEGTGGEAVEVLEEIVSLDPLDGEALLLLGQHHARHGDIERAVFYFERAESLETFEAEAKIRKAQILVGQSRYAEALPLLRRAQEIRPRDDVARYVEQVERAARASR